MGFERIIFVVLKLQNQKELFKKKKMRNNRKPEFQTFILIDIFCFLPAIKDLREIKKKRNIRHPKPQY